MVTHLTEMNMKLELKHIAPYLPYGLKIMRPDFRTVLELHGLCGDLLIFKDPEESYGSILGGQSKPILRPLSEYRQLEDGTMFFTPYTHECNDMDGGLQGNIMSIPYSDFLWLVSERFDVFGLIDQGLAVDINTLNQL